MDDQRILSRIEALVAEEHRLQSDEGGGTASDAQLDEDRGKLDAVTLELDQCWDLLRRRRALREAGANPDDAEPRGSDTVERYLQ